MCSQDLSQGYFRVLWTSAGSYNETVLYWRYFSFSIEGSEELWFRVSGLWFMGVGCIGVLE